MENSTTPDSNINSTPESKVEPIQEPMVESTQEQKVVLTAEQNAEEYKAAQKKRMDALVIGGKDRNGNIINRIFAFSDEYVVYEIETNILSDSIKVWIDTIVEENNKPVENYEKIKPKFAELKGLLYKVEDIDSMKVRIGYILPLAISGNIDLAIDSLDKLKKEINERYIDLFAFRMYFLITSLIFVIINIVIAANCYYSNLFSEHNQIKSLIYVATGGSIGGLISITNRLRNISFESGVGKIWYILYGIQRIVISILFGVVIYFAILTNTIFGFVNNLDLHRSIFGFIIFGVVAGFSETLIPTLLINLEQGKDNKSNTTK